MVNKNHIKQIKLVIWVAIPVILLWLPKTFFDDGQVVCLSRLLLDMECYGCGMTRAIMRLIHFDFQGAAHYNKLSFVVLPLLVKLWYDTLMNLWKKTS